LEYIFENMCLFGMGKQDAYLHSMMLNVNPKP
jgi:hypothetical protein